MSPSVPYSEAERLAAVDTLCILDTPAEARFDRFTRLAARTFQVPISLVSLIDEKRQWFKSRHGLDAQETNRSSAFCSHAVAMRDMLVVENTLTDQRFAENPLVVGEPHIRFYAGQPIFSEGQAVGTLCIIDRIQRKFSDEDQRSLRDLADLVEAELNQVKVAAARLIAEQALKALNVDLERRISERTFDLENKVDALSREASQREAVEDSLRKSENWNHTIVESSYSGFIGTNQIGRIIEWNTSAERIFGWTRAEAVGARFSELIVPFHMRQHGEQGLQHYFADIEDPRADRKAEVPALTSSGRQITVEMTIGAYEWQSQQCLGAFINDISERTRTQLELEEKRELLDAVLETIDVAVVACDAVGNLTIFNRMARSIHGLDLKTISSAEWSRYYSLYHIDGRTPLVLDDIPLVRALKGEIVHDQGMVIAPEGNAAHTMLATGRPLRTAAGRALGAVVAMKDITELNASRQKLAANERQLRAITENLPAMIGKVNAEGQFAFLNNRALLVYGKTAEELIGAEIERAYSTEDFARIKPHIDRVNNGERVFFEYVAQILDREFYYQCSYVPQTLPNGKPDGFLAMAHDITKRKVSEMRLYESEEKLRTITDNVPVLIAYFDSERHYRFANAIHQSWLGKAPVDFLGQTMAEAFGEEYYAQQAEAFEHAWSGNSSQCDYEVLQGNQSRLMHSNFLPRVHNGSVTGMYVLTTDATDSYLQKRSLHALAHTDSLTNLPNRRQFDVALNGAVSQPRSDEKIALLYLDIDFFKKINDEYGHATGDAVLVEFAQRLRAVVRDSDLVARLAGDEFTILLTNINNQADVEFVADKILAKIVEPFVIDENFLHVSTSIGIALASGLECTTSALVQVADQALYSAKDAGRNSYVIFNMTANALSLPALPSV